MRQWLWITPIVLLAGCSGNHSSGPVAAQSAAGSEQAALTPAAMVEPAPVPVVRETVIPRDTALRVRLDQTISTKTNSPGDAFTATLAAPLVVDGETVLPRGTRFGGHVAVAAPSGRFKGRAQLVLSLDTFRRDGKEYEIDTKNVGRVSSSHKKRNAFLIGGGAGIGAAIGAIAGGGKGALIGAGAGAAAGTAGEAATGVKHVAMPAETLLRFTLSEPLRV